MMRFTKLDPRVNYGNIADLVGYIPSFLDESDPRSVREQFDTQYVSGWRPFKGFKMNPETYVMSYPGDPPTKPYVKTQFRDETIVIYPHAWVAVIQKDGSYEVCRMD